MCGKSTNFGSGKLKRMSFASLPLGSIQPTGWLSDQLSLQRHGIFEDMEKYPGYGDDSGWLGGDGESWEDGPYYFRGLIPIAYVTGDQSLISRSETIVSRILDSQTEDGMFGPQSNDDWWPRMPVLMMLRDYYEATEYRGNPDSRIMPFMDKYFRFQLKTLPNRPLTSWAQARGGDNIDSVFWYYDRVYDEKNPEASEWLLTLAEILHSQTEDWTQVMNNSTVRYHVVNTSQAMKTPSLWYRKTGADEDRNALGNGIKNISIDHGRIDELPNSDEAARDNMSYRGSELCGIVEGMLSTEIALRILGDHWLCDRLEKLAYNALPAAYAPDYRGHVYFILQNQILATNGWHEFDCDHGDSSSFAAPCGFDCCFANNHMGWAKFIGSMWMADSHGDLAVAAYGPSTVNYTLLNGEKISIEEKTDYPFGDSINFTYHGPETLFSLKLPIPSWCKNASISVNGEKSDIIPTDGFCTVSRKFSDNDVVCLTLPMEIEFSDWYNRSVAVERGPLVYSLKIGEQWREYDDNGTRELKVANFGKSLKREVFPKTRWNYGLIPDKSLIRIENRPIRRQPFESESAPVVLHAKGQMISEWKLDGNHAGNQPIGGVPRQTGAECDIELVPYGAARLKVTHFPRIDDSVNYVYDNPKICRNDGNDYTNFSNVILPPADDWDLIINSSRDADRHVLINRSETLSNGGRVCGLKSLSEFCRVGMYNEISISGDDIRSIEIVPVNPMNEIQSLSISAKENSFTATVNTDRSNFAYEIDYGTDKKSLTNHIRGFRTNIAHVTGLVPNTEYFFRLSTLISGVRKYSEIYSVKTLEEKGTDEKTDEKEYNKIIELSDFDIYGDSHLIYCDKGFIGASASPNIKALLHTECGWTDFAAEATLCIRQLSGNAGIIFRVNEADSGPDNYRGYYFGIGNGCALVGSADKGWHPMYSCELDIKADKAYNLSVHACGNKIICYVDNVAVFKIYDNRHSRGSVGFRAYLEPFAASDLTVRPLTQNEIDEIDRIDEPKYGPFEISAETAFETIQVRYPKRMDAQFYRIDYGTVPGFYPNAVTDIMFNPYKGSSCFTHDKTAFTFTGTTCYLKMSAWCGDRMIACSDELAVKCKSEDNSD